MILILGMLLDAAAGEPKWLWSRLPHPAVLMGRLIGWCDDRLNTGPHRRLMGSIAMTGCMLIAGAVGAALAAIPGSVVDVLVIGVMLAQRSLSDHVSAVANALRLSVRDGRQAVAQIVGRDTAAMDGPAIARSAIESAAENLSDGVIAPAFWYAVAGLPGLLIYKMINTADSMIGYRTPRHAAFGWAAARIDDFVNWIPARLTAALIWCVTTRSSWHQVRKEAPAHRSPNAGWPEAAMAFGLDIALSGPRSYEGKIRDYPYVNKTGAHDLTPDHIDAAIRVLWASWIAGLCLAGLYALIAKLA